MQTQQIFGLNALGWNEEHEHPAWVHASGMQVADGIVPLSAAVARITCCSWDDVARGRPSIGSVSDRRSVAAGGAVLTQRVDPFASSIVLVQPDRSHWLAREDVAVNTMPASSDAVTVSPLGVSALIQGWHTRMVTATASESVLSSHTDFRTAEWISEHRPQMGT